MTAAGLARALAVLAFGVASAAAWAAGVGAAATGAAGPQAVTVALDFSLTGADADSATRMKDGALLALEQASIPGVAITPMILDDGTPTAGQYDPAQAAINARRMVTTPSVMAAIGPQMSGAAKAMVPILNEGGLAIITPSAVNADLTSARFAEQYRDTGRLTFFRTVVTDQYQAPGIANYFVETLHLRTVFVLDDTGAYGVGLADSFSAQAVRKGLKVLGRDTVDPRAQDYAATLTRIKSLGPDALYYGGVFAAGIKLIKQAYDIIPAVVKAGGDGLYGPEILTAAGFPSSQGWYITVGAPHLASDQAAQKFVKDFTTRFGMAPDDYSVTAYDAATVIVAAVRSVVQAGKPLSRALVREAIAKSRTETLQGTVQFDPNGDLRSKTISIFQVKQDPSRPADDMDANLRYVGVAPVQ